MRRLNDERGAVAVIVAVLMVVLLGMGAVVVDMGALYQERRELQNGADAAAFAIAQDCVEHFIDEGALGIVDCEGHDDSPFALASQYADENALDAKSNVDDVDVFALGTDQDDLLEGGKVVVDTSTKQSNGTTKVMFAFARVLDEDNDGQTVIARATAQWGPVGGAYGLPLTIGACEFYNAPTGVDIALHFHNPSGDEDPTCPSAGPSGSDLPGGFGWLADGDDCRIFVEVGDVADSLGGDPTPTNPHLECVDADFAPGTTLVLPVYDHINDDKSYTIAGLASFVVTGYRFNGGPGGGFQGGDTSLCDPGNSVSCLVGHFTSDILDGSVGEGTNFGTYAINLVPNG